MSDYPFTTRNRSHQSDDEFDVSQFHGGEDNLISWATHPAAVDALFQWQQSDLLEPLPSASGHAFSGAGVAFAGWAGVEASGNTFADFPGSFDYPPQDPTGPCPAPGPVRLETPFTSIAEPSMAVPAPSICEEEDVQTLMLKSLRSAGYGYAAIAEVMRAQLGIEITANALVKRYQKLPKVCESLVAKAISNIMPQVMAQIYAELPHMDDGTLSDEEKQTVNRMLQELPQILPDCVRSSLSRKRRNTQPSS